jgi:hypothetical protein
MIGKVVATTKSGHAADSSAPAFRKEKQTGI